MLFIKRVSYGFLMSCICTNMSDLIMFSNLPSRPTFELSAEYTATTLHFENIRF